MSKRSNILLILTDQQRGDCLGIEGHPVLQTPHMDSIGGNGAYFRRGYSESPTCIPARRTLMSGQAPAVHGMVGMVGGVPWDPPHTLSMSLKLWHVVHQVRTGPLGMPDLELRA